MKDPRKPVYVRPKVLTIPAGEILAALGPVAAGSSKESDKIECLGSPCP